VPASNLAAFKALMPEDPAFRGHATDALQGTGR